MEQKAPFKMAKDYDMQNDFLFMYVTDDYTYKESVELGNNIILDFDENDVPVAIEILEAADYLNIEKYSLKNLINLEMHILIDEEHITIKASFKVVFHQKEIEAPIKLELPNEFDIPQVQSEFALTD